MRKRIPIYKVKKTINYLIYMYDMNVFTKSEKRSRKPFKKAYKESKRMERNLGQKMYQAYYEKWEGEKN